MFEQNEQNSVPSHGQPAPNSNMPLPENNTPPLYKEKPSTEFVFKFDKNSLMIVIAILAIIAALMLIKTGSGSNNIISKIFNQKASRDALAQKAIDYLNKNVLTPGQTAELKNVSEESGVVRLQVKIGPSDYDSYITKDGKLFFPQAFTLDEAGKNNQQSEQVDSSKVVTDGRPFIGNINAPVIMAYWYDYQCPFCKRNHESVITQLVKDYVDSGKVKIIFKQYAFLGSDSTAAALAEHAVWEAAPDKFYKWHEAMFAKQDNENGGWGNKSDILALARSLGIDSNKIDQLMTSKAQEYQKKIDDDKAEGAKYGINGTPGAIIAKQLISGAQPYDTFKAAIEEALK